MLPRSLESKTTYTLTITCYTALSIVISPNIHPYPWLYTIHPYPLLNCLLCTSFHRYTIRYPFQSAIITLAIRRYAIYYPSIFTVKPTIHTYLPLYPLSTPIHLYTARYPPLPPVALPVS